MVKDVMPTTPESAFILKVAIVAALNSIMLGYDISILSSANIFIVETMTLSSLEEEFETGLLNFAAGPGAILAGTLADIIGRRKAVFLNGLIMFIGSMTMAFAGNFAVFCIGRVITGIAVGGGLCIVPLFLAEVAPRHVRGFLVAIGETFTNIGIFLGFFAGWALADLPIGTNWRVMLGVGALPAVAIVLGMPILPESPRWLFLQGREDEAVDVIRRSCASVNDRTTFMEEIKESVAHAGQSSWMNILCPTANIRKILVIGLGLAVLQQTTGIEAAMYYTPDILKKAGITKTSTVLLLTMLLGVLKLIVTFTSGAYVDVVGRRPLAIIGTFAMALSDGIIALGFKLDHAVLTILGQYLFIVSFASSLGPICWVMISELFPLSIRSRSVALATALNRLTSSLVAFSFLSVSEAITPAGLFGCAVLVNVGAATFIYFMLPETKGRTLEEIEQDMVGYRAVHEYCGPSPQPCGSAVSRSTHVD